MHTTRTTTYRLLLTGAVLMVLLVSAVPLLARQCDREVGDETDFPLFVAVGQAACGARTLVGP